MTLVRQSAAVPKYASMRTALSLPLPTHCVASFDISSNDLLTSWRERELHTSFVWAKSER